MTNRGWMVRERFRRMRGLRRLARADGVEVGVEPDRLITVAPQRAVGQVHAERAEPDDAPRRGVEGEGW